MDPFVFAAVLLGAACHAAWNSVLKLRLDPFRTIALIAMASAIVALPALPFVGFPPAAAWPWVLASAVLHLGYYIGLTEAYRTGDMGQVYPIARGSAPLMTAGMSTTFLGEQLGLTKDWVVRIVKHVGNYGEAFERNVGQGSPLKISRGLNALWNKGGIQYAPPVR